jgi:hypothetical protein
MCKGISNSGFKCYGNLFQTSGIFDRYGMIFAHTHTHTHTFRSMRWYGKKIAKAIWGSFCLFGATLFVEDFYQAVNHPDVYPFGAEGPVAGIWYYKTQELYLWFAVILVC